ncbi:MAG: hypothetical protein ACTIK4_03500 [Mesonia sp.]|uniref:hypothetical protein n=1 Tax=Mesonia sp. TaxID=1960830 RepID=UPI003F9BA2B1
MFKTKRLVILLGIFGLLLGGCKDNSENKNATDDDSSSITEAKNGAYANFHLDDGSTVKMNLSVKQKGGLGEPTNFSAHITDYSKLLVMLKILNSEQPITTKTYEGVQLTVTSPKKKVGFDEMYRSWHFKSKDGEEGQSKITFTTINKKHAEGTFSGTLYSKSHRKATVEGEFMIKKEKE